MSEAKSWKLTYESDCLTISVKHKEMSKAAYLICESEDYGELIADLICHLRSPEPERLLITAVLSVAEDLADFRPNEDPEYADLMDKFYTAASAVSSYYEQRAEKGRQEITIP